MKQDNQSAKKLLDIRHRPNGGVVINRYPFETVFNNDEWEEFVSYCTSHSSAPTEQEIREKVLKELIDWLVLYRIELAQHITHSNLYHCNRFHIQLLKLLNHSTPTPEAHR